MEKYIKTEEVMELIGVTRQCLYIWRKEGILKAYCPGSGIVRYKMSDVEKLMQSASPIAEMKRNPNQNRKGHTKKKASS